MGSSFDYDIKALPTGAQKKRQLRFTQEVTDLYSDVCFLSEACTNRIRSAGPHSSVTVRYITRTANGYLLKHEDGRGCGVLRDTTMVTGKQHTGDSGIMGTYNEQQRH